MQKKITIEQAFNNLNIVIEGIRFLPAEYTKINQAMQIMAQTMLPDSAADAAASSRNGKKKAPAAK